MSNWFPSTADILVAAAAGIVAYMGLGPIGGIAAFFGLLWLTRDAQIHPDWPPYRPVEGLLPHYALVADIHNAAVAAFRVVRWLAALSVLAASMRHGSITLASLILGRRGGGDQPQ